jgi:hypothetical protein
MIWFAAGCLLAVVWSGCASKKNLGPAFHAGDEQIPEFLNGPAVVLLTNAVGYSAHVTTDIRRPYSERPLSGTLLQRQGRLVFQPDEVVVKKRPGAGMIFIWDANLRRGWAVSEALQGYAPVTGTLEVTNIQTEPGAAISETVNGHACHRSAVTVSRADGSAAVYKVWQADDLRHFPVRLQSASGGRPITVNLSELIFDSPSEQLFNPPDGFVKYNTPVALMNELIIRETTVGQRNEPDFQSTAPPPRGAEVYQPDPAR